MFLTNYYILFFLVNLKSFQSPFIYENFIISIRFFYFNCLLWNTYYFIVLNYCFYDAECHNKLRGYYGVIESPNFPNKYDHATNCSWIIEAPIGNTINLTFSHFDLEGQTNAADTRCIYDYVQIMEGDDDTPNNELGRLCGSIDLPKKINSTQHQVFITFVTDSFIAFNGFRLEWTVHGCGGHLNKPYDSFTSPGYPSGYPMNVDCEWLIEVDYTHSVEITFYEVDISKEIHAKIYTVVPAPS